MWHVCGFIYYSCVELKLMINTGSLSNQALKSAHPSLLSSRCWPWGVFIGAGQPLQHGEVRALTNLACVRPVPVTVRRHLCTETAPVSLWDGSKNKEIIPNTKGKYYTVLVFLFCSIRCTNSRFAVDLIGFNTHGKLLLEPVPTSRTQHMRIQVL